MGILSHSEILSLHDAAVSAKLASSRSALLAGMDAKLVASLPDASSPSEQILCDLSALNAAKSTVDGALPLALWLDNAATLASSLRQSALFRRARALCERAAEQRVARPAADAAPRLTRASAFRIVAAGTALALMAIGVMVTVDLHGKQAPAPDPSALIVTPPAGMVLVQGRHFVMGSSLEEAQAALSSCSPTEHSNCGVDRFMAEVPRREVTVSPFFLDIYEVTNEDLADWLNRQSDLRVDSEGLVWQRESSIASSSRGTNKDHELARLRLTDGSWKVIDAIGAPVVLVTWTGAQRYCTARGGRLPTEAEWELAARGPERRTFAWGNEAPTCDRLVFARVPGGACEGRGRDPDPVLDLGGDRTPDGIAGMTGNVREWVLDVFGGAYGQCPPPCRDPGREVHDAPRVEHVIRGGGYLDSASLCRAARRGHLPAHEVDETVGFRCARPIDDRATPP